MRTNLLVGGAVFAAAVMSGATAMAGPINLGPGATFGKFNGVEQVNFNGTGFNATSGTTGSDCAGCVSAAGNPENAFGVFVVSDLEPGKVTIANQDIAANGPPYFVNGGGGATFGHQIMGIFYGETATPVPGGAITNGGVLDLYWWDSNNQSQAGIEGENPGTFRTAQDQFTNVTCGTPITNGATGCQFLARLDLVPGGVDNCPAPCNAVDPAHTALSNSLNGNAGGVSDFYLEVDLSAGGAWANQLDGQWFLKNFDGLGLPDIADVRGEYDNTHCAGGSGGTGACGLWAPNVNSLGEELQDPFKIFASGVPEPATLTLLGTALLGLGARRRARNRK